ncbi:lens epithelium-derived growth factor-like [Cloeon dipterum]|uniref:lens epithelium-derived growth factor-like n=1 Tax=Cloeon dipterum TaxID=197152 RepID=UPI0032200937
MVKGGRKSSVAATPVEVRTYSKGELVFAKVRGHPAWPARIEEVFINQNNALNRYTVLFFGTHQFSQCKNEDLCKYEELCDAMRSKYKTKRFVAAMKEVEENPGIVILQPNQVADQEEEALLALENSGDKAEGSEDEDSSEQPGSSSKKIKSAKSATQKRKTKPIESEDDDHSSVERPASKKRKLSSLRIKLNTPTRKTGKVDEEPVVEKKAAENETPATKTRPLPELPQTKQGSANDPECDEDLYLEYREPEDENMPDDERIVRKLIKNSVWESKTDDVGLDIVIRKMGYYFNEDKIKNWDPSELKEMINSERAHAKEKIQECLTFDQEEELKKSESVPEKRVKEKDESNGDSDEDPDQDDVDKGEGVFIKHFTRNQVDLMLQLKHLRCSPDYFAYVVQLVLENPDNDFSLDSQPLPLEEQRRLYTNEEKYQLLTGEIRDKLPKGEKHDTKTAIALLENILEVELTKVMVCKYPNAAYILTRLLKYEGSKNEGMSDEEQSEEKVDADIIRGLTEEVIKKLQALILPKDWEKSFCSDDGFHSDQDGENSQADNKSKHLKSKGLWMLHDLIRAAHLVMTRAAEGNADEYAKILQPTVAIQMTKSQCRKLKTMMWNFKSSPYRLEKEACFKTCALARSLHPWSDVPADLYLPVLQKQRKDENDNGTKESTDKKETTN